MVKTLLTMLLAVGLAVPAFANMDMGEHRGGHGHMEMCSMCKMDGMDDMGGMMDKCLAHAAKLGLSEEQMTKIKPIHRQMEKLEARFKADLKIAQIDLKEIMETKNFDLEKATAQIKKVGDIKTMHHLEMLKYLHDVRAVLTDEQFKKMHQMMHGKMEEHEHGEKMMDKM